MARYAERAVDGAGAREKTQGALRDLVLMQARDGRDTAVALAAMPDGRAKREAQRRLQSGAYASPRTFFG